MRILSFQTASLVTAASLLALTAGCNKHRDDDESYEYSQQPHINQQAVAPYEVKDQNGVKYAVLQQGAIVTSNIDGWHAMSPEFFGKLSGITVQTPPDDKTYHAGYGYVIPKIEADPDHPDRKIGRISAGGLVPKELSGWVAVDQRTLESLIQKYMSSEPKK